MKKWILQIIGLAFALILFIFAYQLLCGSGGKVKIGSIEVEVKSETKNNSYRTFPEPKPNKEVPKDTRTHIEQKSEGNQSQNIVTKGNVDIRIDNEKPEK